MAVWEKGCQLCGGKAHAPFPGDAWHQQEAKSQHWVVASVWCWAAIGQLAHTLSPLADRTAPTQACIPYACCQLNLPAVGPAPLA